MYAVCIFIFPMLMEKYVNSEDKSSSDPLEIKQRLMINKIGNEPDIPIYTYID